MVEVTRDDFMDAMEIYNSIVEEFPDDIKAYMPDFDLYIRETYDEKRKLYLIRWFNPDGKPVYDLTEEGKTKIDMLLGENAKTMLRAWAIKLGARQGLI